jgi:hypothetical protein
MRPVDSITEVRYGGVVVGRSPQLRDRSDTGAFVVFGEPLPVGTALVLKIDEKDQHARVTEVVESADASAAGMRVRFVSAAQKAAPAPAPQPAPAPAVAAAPAVAQTGPESGSSPVPVAVGGSEGSSASAGVPSSGDASAQHGGDSHGHHERRKRRRK